MIALLTALILQGCATGEKFFMGGLKAAVADGLNGTSYKLNHVLQSGEMNRGFSIQTLKACQRMEEGYRRMEEKYQILLDYWIEGEIK